MDLFNRYSYVLITVLLVAAGIAYMITTQEIASGGFATLSVLALALIYFVLARRGRVTPANPEKRVRRARGAGRPVVVHFYSDFHLGSLLKRPLVAGVEREYRGRCEFIYIDMNHPEAEGVASSLEARLGQFLVYDAAGKLVERTGRLFDRTLRDLLEKPV